jgi:hypothetical protein
MRFNRRNFIKAAGATGLALAAAPATVLGNPSGGIDRQALVRWHNPVVTRFDPFSALSVGNGELAFTADVTGLQTFAAESDGGAVDLGGSTDPRAAELEWRVVLAGASDDRAGGVGGELPAA